jgi:hypothetical protein
VGVIWKFPLRLRDEQVIEIPQPADLLCVQTQDDNAMLWAMVDPEADKRPVTIYCVGTGHLTDDVDRLTYLGTTQHFGGRFVGHWFDGPVL